MHDAGVNPEMSTVLTPGGRVARGYLAGCNTCGEYVSPSLRATLALAQADADAHRERPDVAA